MSLNSYSSQASDSSFLSKLSTWQLIVLVTLLFWMSASLVLDFIIMPGMYAAGMMATPDFATAGYSIFWLFNRVEVMCAALVLTGVFALRHLLLPRQTSAGLIGLAALLMAIALSVTYGLTPAMGALGLHLNLFEAVEPVPATMNLMHSGYFGLELLKLAGGAALAALCFRRLSQA